MTNNVVITAADGHHIPTKSYRRGGSHLLIASHGITSEKTEDGLYENFFRRLPDRFDAIMFDFRGHGDSQMGVSDVTVAGEILDLMAVLTWARSQSYESISHLATSFGASVTLLAMSAYDLGFLSKVIFWNPVINYRNTFIDAKVEWGRTFFDQSDILELALRPFTAIPETDFKISSCMTQELLVMRPDLVTWPSSIPLLVIHGDSDTLVPVEDAISYAKENDTIELVILKGVDHGFDNLVDDAINKTIVWLDEN